MEKDKFNELQSKISGIEAELERAKLELEASNKEATIEEIRSYFEKAKRIIEEYNLGKEELKENVDELIAMINRKLSDPDPNQYAIAKQYYQSFKERFDNVEEVVRELGIRVSSLSSLVKIIKVGN